MIVIENIGNAERRYSDQGVKLRQVETGTLWNDAINVPPCPYTYEETDIPCDPAELSAEEILGILLGGEAT